MNNCVFVGRLVAKPELRTTASGTSVCAFTLAVDRRFGGANGEKTADFIDFVAWRQTAEFICKWFDKGNKIGVSGELQTRLYEKDGKKHKVSEVVVSAAEFVESKKTEYENVVFDADSFVPVDGDNEDLPF